MGKTNKDFKARLLAGTPMAATFVKTPHPTVIEILGRTGLSAVVLDAEHASFDRAAIDLCIMAGRTVDLPVLVRVPEPGWILSVLDMGAAGVVVPHVTSATQAAELARLVHYGPGGRGFAGSTRAAEFTKRPMAAHFEETADEVTLFCQIEDPEGYAAFQEIAAVDGVDALFVGRADLAISHGYRNFFQPEIGDMCAEILGAKGATNALYTAPGEPLDRWQAAGARFFVIGSEHTMMLSGGAAMAAAVAALGA